MHLGQILEIELREGSMVLSRTVLDNFWLMNASEMVGVLEMSED